MNKEQPYNDLPLLPPSIDLNNAKLLNKTISASRKLAELKGIVNPIPNQGLLINGIVLQEARLSSEIENIVTTTDNLYQAAASQISNSNDPQAKEVLRYRKALWHGFKTIQSKPLSLNLFIDIVSIIHDMKLTIRKVPGTKIANSLGEVIYTPPEGENVILEKLSNLEQFIHSDDKIDPLIKLAIMHYQFEAIHPFTDGNGRTGRILNILYLVEKKLLEKPILFLSRYILETKITYYKLLREVTENAKWLDWILYILDAIESTANETQKRVTNILAAMENAQQLIQEKAPKIYSKDLVEVIFEHPYSKVSFLEQKGIAKRQTAASYLKKLEEIGLLTSVQKWRETYYINNKLIKILIL